MKKLKSLFAIFSYINNHPLAGRHRLIAYTNFIYWQITQLLKPSEKKIRFVAKTFLLVTKGMKGATGNIYVGLHDFSEMGFLLHYLRKGDLFADIGANIGSYSILASGVNDANTIAFEPSRKAFEQLKKNIFINHLESNIKAYNLALGDCNGKQYFTTDLDTVNYIVPFYELENTLNRIEVNVDTLDSFVKDHGVPVMIKIDVEGFESNVLNGMKDILANASFKALIIELNGSGLRYDHDEGDIHAKLISYGFQPYLYDPFERSFFVKARYGIFNTLYLRDIDHIKRVVKQGKKVKIFNESF